MKQKNIVLVVGIAAIVGATAWYLNAGGDDKPGAKGGGRGQGEQPPAVVNVVAPVRQDVPVTLQANGTVTPANSVDLRPQTTSTIRKVHIKEGQSVKAGDLMFSLDDRNEQANVSQAKAQLARDRATLADLERQYKRNQELVAQKFLAQSAIDTLRSQVEAQRALIAANQAALQGERVAASYGTIRAPMSGRVGAISVYPGSLVQPATSLTTVTQLDPVNVAFTLPESALPDLLAAQRAGSVTVEAQPSGGKPSIGKLNFIDNTVDAQAGTIKVKAQFDNRDTMLWPGQYVTTRVTLRTLKDATVIPQAAIITNTGGTFVYVVGEGQAAKQVPVQRVHAMGDSAVVTGLAGTEKVITEGKQNLRPGGKVRLAGARPDSAIASKAATP
ncbi:MAG TPA: efflux RND transporter periplasmic adaptor subunit [Telluria sp.]